MTTALNSTLTPHVCSPHLANRAGWPHAQTPVLCLFLLVAGSPPLTPSPNPPPHFCRLKQHPYASVRPSRLGCCRPCRRPRSLPPLCGRRGWPCRRPRWGQGRPPLLPGGGGGARGTGPSDSCARVGEGGEGGRGGRGCPFSWTGGGASQSTALRRTRSCVVYVREEYGSRGPVLPGSQSVLSALDEGALFFFFLLRGSVLRALACILVHAWDRPVGSATHRRPLPADESCCSCGCPAAVLPSSPRAPLPTRASRLAPRPGTRTPAVRPPPRRYLPGAHPCRPLLFRHHRVPSRPSSLHAASPSPSPLLWSSGTTKQTTTR